MVADEWPIMGDGRESAQVQGWLDGLGITVAGFSPQDARESTAYAQWFERDNDRREGRRGRLGEATPLVPTFLWGVLVLAALVVVGSVVLFADPGEGTVVQALMIGSLTVVIALGLLVVRHLDRPYGSIEPTEMRRTLALMESSRLAVPSTQSSPCDDRGRPLDG